MAGFLSGIAGGATVAITIKAIDEFSNVFKQVSNETEKIDTNLLKLGATAGVVFAALTTGIVKSINAFSDFDKNIQRAGANTEATSEQLEQFRQIAINAAEGTSLSFQDTSRALAYLAGGSVSAEDAIATLSDTVRFAAAGNLELEQAAVITSQAMTLFKIPAEEVISVLDILTKSSQISYATSAQMSDAFSEAAPIAAQLGISIIDLTAILGAMGDAGFLGSEAGVALKRAFKELLTPSAKMEEALGKLGLTSDELKLKLNDPIEVIKMLEKGLINIQDPIERATILSEIFGQISGPAMAGLLQVGSESIDNYKRDLEGASGALMDTTNRLESAVSPFKILTDSVSELSITIGQILSPILKDLIEKYIKPVIDSVIAWTKEHPELTSAIIFLVTTIAGLTAGIIAVTAVVWLFNTAILANPIGLIVLAVAALVAGLIYLYTQFQLVRDIVSILWELLKFALWPILVAIQIAIDVLSFAWKSIVEFMKPVIFVISEIVSWIKELISWINKITFGIFDTGAKSVSDFNKEVAKTPTTTTTTTTTKTGTTTTGTTPTTTTATSATGATTVWTQTGPNAWIAEPIKLNDFIISKGQVYQTNVDDVIMGTKDGRGMGGTSIIINIDKVQGVDASDIAEALQRELLKVIRA